MQWKLRITGGEAHCGRRGVLWEGKRIAGEGAHCEERGALWGKKRNVGEEMRRSPIPERNMGADGEKRVGTGHEGLCLK